MQHTTPALPKAHPSALTQHLHPKGDPHPKAGSAPHSPPMAREPSQGRMLLQGPSPLPAAQGRAQPQIHPQTHPGARSHFIITVITGTELLSHESGWGRDGPS